jgi:hypothetical protein
LKGLDNFKKNDLIYVKPHALTYSLTANLNINKTAKILGLIIKQVEKRAKPTGNVNFDNAALYYIMTTLGCLTVFEFDLEKINGKKENSSN